MGISERKEREKQRRNNDIIDAAERVFFSKGINDTTMDDIAKEAELSKGTLYLYFKNKVDLIFAAKLRGYSILKSMFEEVLASKDTGLNKVLALGYTYYNFIKNYKNYYSIFVYCNSIDVTLREASNYKQEVQACNDILISNLSKVVSEGIDDGSIGKDKEPEKTAIILSAMFLGTVENLLRMESSTTAAHFYDRFTTEELIASTEKMIKDSLCS
ncbi:MAG: TetR/AcrR family transcriptional regulator [Bacillota bacterium]|nr:TetR/AcrR family transcriptional regulator [Bacillota bacterium]